ncbi:protein FAM210B, mitochondrial isoform X1 [Hippoglossus hippoglossus]|uniref:protein FAM210B, mitochondrial isoform X1 n=1 Tax=Hippoglossus hippoglossus TaxID=8267 RepID=UPI00148CD5EA|nr:protein FAM210B, mitochondrial isoform X1 [Hippoglossus hippoglossus]
MFWWRAGRLSAAAADQALRSPGCCLVRVNANRLRHVTGTLRKGHTVRCRSVCGSVDSTTHAHLGAQQSEPRPLLSWTLGVADSDRRHWERVAENLFRSVRSEGGSSDVIKPPPVHAKRRHGSGEQPLGRVLFTGTWRVSSRTVHTRASSIAAAAKRSDPGEETGADKRDEQNLKEASSTSSSAEKVPGEPEPEGGKPTKIQQLKKVFKEYGAVGVCFHVGISLMSLGMFYLLISSGFDMAAVLCKLGFSEAVVRSKMAAGTSTFVLAYAIHKLFAPVRISITLVSVPLIVRYLRKTGLFKPPTPAP